MTLQNAFDVIQATGESALIVAELAAAQGTGAPGAGSGRSAGAVDGSGVFQRNGLLNHTLLSDFRLAEGTLRRTRGG